MFSFYGHAEIENLSRMTLLSRVAVFTFDQVIE